MIKCTEIDRARAGEDPTHDPYVDRAYYFAGDVNVQSLVGTDESGEVELLALFFAAGARTRPHIHERDQILHFTEGQGIVATDTERYQASPGDVFTIPAGTWHWRGAAGILPPATFRSVSPARPTGTWTSATGLPATRSRHQPPSSVPYGFQ
jgi:quercetin dioxygenase-like cupin family protein